MITIIGIIALGALSYTDNLNRDQRFYTRTCERNNLIKAITRTNIREGLPKGVGSPQNRHRNDVLQPILNCTATFQHDGNPIPLTADQDRRFLNIIQRGKIPIMSPSGGRIIGSRQPEQGSLADF
jgi:hypothetical protein